MGSLGLKWNRWLVGPADLLLSSVALPLFWGPRPRRKDKSAVKPKPQLANLSQQSQVNHSPDGVESFLCSTEWGGIKRNSLNLPNRFWDLKRAQLLYIIYNPGCQSQSNPLFVCSNTQIPRHCTLSQLGLCLSLNKSERS